MAPTADEKLWTLCSSTNFEANEIKEISQKSQKEKGSIDNKLSWQREDVK